MFLHHVNNIEHNIKQNIYTGLEVISLIPPCVVYKNSKNENVLIIRKKSQNKQTMYFYNFFRVMHSFPKTGTESC